MRLFVELCFLERGRGGIATVIGHGVLAVLVEETLIKLTSEIVRVFSVLARLVARIEAVDCREHFLGSLAQRSLRFQRPFTITFGILGHEEDEVANIVRFFDMKPSPHEGFARANLRVAGNVIGCFLVGQADVQGGLAF